MEIIHLKYLNILKTTSTCISRKRLGHTLRSLWGRRPKDASRPNIIRSSLGLDKSQISKPERIKLIMKKYINAPTGTPSLDTWSKFEKDALSSIKEVNSTNFDGLVMKMFTSDRVYDKAASFLEYVTTVRKPNDIVLAHFMILAADCSKESKALETYNKLNKSLLIVPTMASLVIQALSKTHKWKECIELYRKLDEISLPSLIEIAAAAFRNNEPTLGRQLIKEVMDSGVEPNSFVLTRWLQAIIGQADSNEAKWLTSELLTCLKRTEHILTLENAMLLKQVFFRTFFLNMTPVYIDSTGNCLSCGHHLECPELTSEEHSDLQNAIRERIDRGSNSYLESHPRELQVFLKFLEKSKPYDIVLDGLNVAHHQPEQKPQKLAQLLLDVVTHLHGQGLKPMVLCKKHVWFWSPSLLQKVEHRAQCFYADNISADDPFIIYAALYGGPKTLVMTFDMMRDHYFLLQENRLKELFRRWTISRQVFFSNNNNNKIDIHHHQKFGLHVQGSWENGWHIPYEQDEPYKYHLPFGMQKLHWLCSHGIKANGQPSQQRTASVKRLNKG